MNPFCLSHRCRFKSSSPWPIDRVTATAFIKEIEEATNGPMKSSTGTLYLAIERLEQEGLIEETPSDDVEAAVLSAHFSRARGNLTAS